MSQQQRTGSLKARMRVVQQLRGSPCSLAAAITRQLGSQSICCQAQRAPGGRSSMQLALPQHTHQLR
jgi:hypothetical protein